MHRKREGDYVSCWPSGEMETQIRSDQSELFLINFSHILLFCVQFQHCPNWHGSSVWHMTLLPLVNTRWASQGTWTSKLIDLVHHTPFLPFFLSMYFKIFRTWVLFTFLLAVFFLYCFLFTCWSTSWRGDWSMRRSHNSVPPQLVVSLTFRGSILIKLVCLRVF